MRESPKSQFNFIFDGQSRPARPGSRWRDNFDRGGRRDDRGGGRRDDRGGGRASRGGGTGKLTVGTKPWGQIFVDGRLAHPEGPLVGYKLSAGRHRVYVCFQADRSRCTRPKTVVIRPGETTRLNIR